MEPENLDRLENKGVFNIDMTSVTCDPETCFKVRQGIDSDQLCSCHMNRDPSLHLCSVLQEQLPSSPLCEQGLKVVYSQLPVGSLVMVKAGRWPWWPAILSPDPVSGEFVRPNRGRNIEKYHVEFLGTSHSRFWATVKDVELYHVWKDKPRTVKGSLRKSYMIAMKEAVKLKDIRCEERLQMSHFRHINESRWLKKEDTVIIGGFVFKSWTCLEDMVVGTNSSDMIVKEVSGVTVNKK